MTGHNFYCSGSQCRRTTKHVCVRMQRNTYFYCVACGRRLESRANVAQPAPQSAEGIAQ